MTSNTEDHEAQGMDRRDFLRVGAAGALTLQGGSGLAVADTAALANEGLITVQGSDNPDTPTTLLTTGSGRPRLRYNKYLAYCFAGETDVNQELVAQGLVLAAAGLIRVLRGLRGRVGVALGTAVAGATVKVGGRVAGISATAARDPSTDST